MQLLLDLIRKGYFPKELPPPFKTDSFADFVSNNTLGPPYTYNKKKGPDYTSSPIKYFYARAGSLRRTLNIPNPVNFYQLAEMISKNWKKLLKHINRTKYSLSIPTIISERDRALERKFTFEELAEIKAKNRSSSKYLLKADISSFYHSIYTHTIPWALHKKEVAKNKRHFRDLLGNKLDKILSNGQDRQTKGIPIGPDTSLIISEIILSEIDVQIKKKLKLDGIRYIDDYEFLFDSLTEAETAKGTIQGILNDYELFLNPLKTQVMGMPLPINPDWVSKLSGFNIRIFSKEQKRDLIKFFDIAFELSRAFTQDSVLKYALNQTTSITITDNWELYESLSLQCAILEPGAVTTTLDILKNAELQGLSVNKNKIASSLMKIIKMNAIQGNSSEVAWAIWGFLLFKIKLEKPIVNLLEKMSDPIVGIITLHARAKGLITTGNQFTNWKKFMRGEELQGENWILAYEALIRGWLPPYEGKDYIKSHSAFKKLRDKNIYFYDDNEVNNYKPKMKFESLYGTVTEIKP